MKVIYINGEAKEIDTDIIRQKVNERLPRHWKDE